MNVHDLSYVFVGVLVTLSVFAWRLFFSEMKRLDLEAAMKPVDDMETFDIEGPLYFYGIEIRSIEGFPPDGALLVSPGVFKINENFEVEVDMNKVVAITDLEDLEGRPVNV